MSLKRKGTPESLGPLVFFISVQHLGEGYAILRHSDRHIPTSPGRTAEGTNKRLWVTRRILGMNLKCKGVQQVGRFV